MASRYIIALALCVASLSILWYVYNRQDKPIAPVHHRQKLADYEPRDWNSDHLGKLNISVFAFRDRNRNGRYDMGDMPQASLAVRLTRPDGETRLERSNPNGFTNFSMSLDSKRADVSLADMEYAFEVLVPGGWTVTTDNTQQVTRFAALPGSISGLMAEQPPSVVGLAPDLTVSGRLGETTSGAQVWHTTDISLVSIDPNGQRVQRVLNEDRSFSFSVGPGKWRLEIENQTLGEMVSRSFQVDDVPVQLSAIVPGQQQPAPLKARQIQDFEYLQHSKIGKIPGGESGLGWDYLVAVHNQLYGGPGYVNILRSGKMVGYNSSGHPVTIFPEKTGQHFDFVGAYFAAAWPQAEGETLRIEAWRGETQVASEQLSLSYLGPVWFQGDYRGIDKLVLSTAHYWQFVTEDMEFRLADDR